MRCAGAVAGAVAATIAAGDALAAPPQLAQLPSPSTRLTAEPPLKSEVQIPESRWPGRLASKERIIVGVDRTGRPVAVRVFQRLALDTKGDYVFAVPAPLRDVRAGPGSESEPGLRTDLMLWQGFSPGRRLLVADAKLDPRQAAVALPLRVRIRRSGDVVSMTVENTTSVSAVAVTGVGEPRELRRILAGAASLGAGEEVSARLSGPVTGRDVRVEAPLRIEGTLVFRSGALAGARATGGRIAGNGVRFATLLGGGSPLRFEVTVRGARTDPRLRLKATPVIPAALLRAPAGLDGRQLLARTVETLLRVARKSQYETYLANPDPRGSSKAVYEYRTAAERPTVSPASSTGDKGGGAWRIVLISVALILSAALLVIAWAHA